MKAASPIILQSQGITHVNHYSLFLIGIVDQTIFVIVTHSYRLTFVSAIALYILFVHIFSMKRTFPIRV